MKIKKIVILLLIITVILGMSITVKAKADSYKISLNPDKTTLKPGDTITISLNASEIDIESGDKGIGSYEGTIEYDTNIFENLKMLGNDDWERPSINGGMFTSVRADGECVSNDQELATITLTVKSDAKEGQTTIKVKDFGASNALSNIATNDVSLTVEVKKESSGGNTINNTVDDNNIVDNNVVDNNTIDNDVDDNNVIDNNATTNNNSANENKTNSQNNKISSNISGGSSSTAKNGILPNTGASSVVIVFAVICIISGVYSYIRYKTTY